MLYQNQFKLDDTDARFTVDKYRISKKPSIDGTMPVAGLKEFRLGMLCNAVCPIMAKN